MRYSRGNAATCLVTRDSGSRRAGAFASWKTIQLGTFKNAIAMLGELGAAGCSLSEPAVEIIRSDDFTLAPGPTSIELVAIKVAELGFKFSATYGEICSKAAEAGLGLCPAEVGPQLRLQYPDQPQDQMLRIAMDAIAASHDDDRIFVLKNSSEQSLWALDGNARAPWFSGSYFVFARN